MHPDFPDSVSLSLIFLAYNEEANIAEVLEEAVSYCSELRAKGQGDCEIIVVDDGSSDKTAEVAEKAAHLLQKPSIGADQGTTSGPKIRVVRHSSNKGMGAGMRTGIRAAKKSHFVFLAADGQTPAKTLDALLPLLARADIVTSVYPKSSRGWQRGGMSKGLRGYMKALAGISFRLEGLYLFPSELGRDIVSKITADTFFFSFALIDIGISQGATLQTTVMPYTDRLAGNSKVANFRRIAKVAKEVARYAVNKRLNF